MNEAVVNADESQFDFHPNIDDSHDISSTKYRKDHGKKDLLKTQAIEGL